LAASAQSFSNHKISLNPRFGTRKSRRSRTFDRRWRTSYYRPRPVRWRNDGAAPMHPSRFIYTPSPPGDLAMFAKLLCRVLVAAALGLGLIGASDAQQVVRVGSTPTGIPFTFLDTKTNQISGIMVDIIKEIGKDQGFTAEVSPMTFSTLIASLQANKIDVIAAAMYITAPRQEIVDFSDPIYTYGDGLVVSAKDPKDYKTLEDLKGEVVGAQIGTAYVKPLQDSGLFKEIKVYDSIPDIIRDVNIGRIKAGFADYPIVAYQIAQGGYPEARVAKNYKSMLVGSVGIAVRKGDKAMLDKINASLRKMKADGTIDKILANWGLK
jgi:polar amino acid transport system substrate-binding protein